MFKLELFYPVPAASAPAELNFKSVFDIDLSFL